MDISKLSMENINDIQFTSIDPVEYPVRENVNYRISESDLDDMPAADEVNQAELRIRIIDIFENQLDASCTKVEEVCDIKRTLFSKYIHGKARLSKSSLIKLIIGLKLGENEGQDLLELNGTSIDWGCRFDFIAYCAMRDKDELEDFYNCLEVYGCKPISNS